MVLYFRRLQIYAPQSFYIFVLQESHTSYQQIFAGRYCWMQHPFRNILLSEMRGLHHSPWIIMNGPENIMNITHTLRKKFQ